ncbi:MAG: hypothetical protein A2268_10505 [Candidatus Raymondbacteria bacterium RifOxyA12_full_50_37]|uniref:HTH araC/xylS-type domain-containing protein n=1 Tax=Candidatus Raymondbacteria bacterium RIFOXYD12_FULL_49_13 TaxID=1817890 RepID=A0A1F7F8S3_UNCRA|nr:MAG: hypothetical protein A2268_10505 [Candidatus Raymondbacteria bacterium RifOxyA12_full_50_37]OGJ85395.1 MAG: hypothetical protein A2248_12290 [Candidatus Raymondbacteria bacterium RIFOXYA2_FULL_49_16]OGJ94903.1 MAG: hypothetical protein A2453_07760 [Candidatus Raymondbacteria bacterium RIFOXYC2_FULL_50_21]OGK00001.1 MAG: hypothetical protein A2487_11665 [Candidatus Raymondbacteria bacterium RifOxyC12_full_50_8]OGK01233.1 MAG: hypothetical protein A2350_11460 [Candidatus Raymondbacteria b
MIYAINIIGALSGLSNEKGGEIKAAVFAAFVLCLLFAILIRRNKKERHAAAEFPESWKRMVQEAEKLLLDNYSDSGLNGNSVADKIQLGRQRLHIVYRRVKGKSMSQHLQEIRVEKASDMLEKTVTPVTEIGRKAGFSDQHDFIRAFEKIKGLTPSQYRDRQRDAL